MFDRLVINLVIAFALRQLAKFGEQMNWGLLRVDAKVRVDQLLPLWLEPAAHDLIDHTIDAVIVAVKDVADLKALIAACLAGDGAKALAALKDLLSKILSPSAEHAKVISLVA